MNVDPLQFLEPAVQRASGLIMDISVDRSEIASQPELTDGNDCKACCDHGGTTWEDLAVSVEKNHCRSEVTECMSLGDSAWAGDRESRRSTTAVLAMQEHFLESVSCSQTVIAHSGEAEFNALRAAGAMQRQHISNREGDGQCMRWFSETAPQPLGCRPDQAQANSGISVSKSS